MQSRADAAELQNWWRHVDATDSYQRKTRLVRTANESDSSFSFYGNAPVNGKEMAVMGEVEERIFDQPKGSNVEQLRTELREFVFRYLMRVSDFRKPSAYVDDDPCSPGNRWLEPISFCQKPSESRQGFGYAQWLAQPTGDQDIFHFPHEQRHEIVDARQVGEVWDWLLLRVNIFDFSFSFGTAKANSPQLKVPLDESSFLVVAPEFNVDQTGLQVAADGERVVGQYGFGYSFVPNPSPGRLGYGPGDFKVAFQLIHFRILENGQIKVRLVFVANRLKQVVRVPIVPLGLAFEMADLATLGVAKPILEPLQKIVGRVTIPNFDPVTSLIDFANFSTAGQTGKQLCISRDRLEQIFLVRHFIQHHEMISGALQTWRSVQNWRNELELPRWVVSGLPS